MSLGNENLIEWFIMNTHELMLKDEINTKWYIILSYNVLSFHPCVNFSSL